MQQKLKVFFIFLLCLSLWRLDAWGAENIRVYYNGEHWNETLEIQDKTFVDAFRIGLVRGIYEGFYAFDRFNSMELYYWEIDFEEMIQKIDVFYQDKRNIGIPVPYAIAVISKELRGEDPRAIRTLLRQFRQIYAL